MDLATIRTYIKRTFGDESGVQVTDDDITRWVNSATRQIVLENEGLLEATKYADSVNGTAEYVDPVDLLVFRGLSYKGPGELSYTRLRGYSLNEFNEYIDTWDGTTQSKGLPLVYMRFAGKLTLFPTPDHDLVSAMKIYYNRKPVPVVNPTDVPEIPELYHEAIVNICLSYAYEMDEDWDAVQAKGNQISTDIKLLRGRDDWKEQETYPTITVRAEDRDF